MPHVLPRYPDCATTNAELLVAGTSAIDHFDVFGSPCTGASFKTPWRLPTPGHRLSSRFSRG
jgi:hypothetical protein